ncbi:transaldolase [Sneathia sanguinegens]|uniref:transaldolase n=1 Tax=Sneathia sanguinegens TaxID=40543 RepID=UPI00290F14CF|nr:transaldolase [Sneathia sanguinegens]MDU7497311.1 transaldolase [Sneathia sanguinegens]
MSVKIFADGANLEEMLKIYESGLVQGFTTNPSLMKKGGVKSYKEFSKKVLEKIKDVPVSFEVFTNELDTMYKEAKEIASWGENVFVKIPIMTVKKESTASLIKKLSAEGVKVNVTAVFTVEQVKEAVDAFDKDVPGYVSIFAGRISDAGYNHMPIMEEARKICNEKPKAELLWASTREVYNIFQAELIGADIITCPNSVIYKYSNKGASLLDLSYNTVETFAKDISNLGFSVFE